MASSSRQRYIPNLKLYNLKPLHYLKENSAEAAAISSLKAWPVWLGRKRKLPQAIPRLSWRGCGSRRTLFVKGSLTISTSMAGDPYITTGGAADDIVW